MNAKILIIILIITAAITNAVLLEETEIKSEFEYIEPAIITKESTLDALIKAEQDLKEMQTQELTTYFIQDSLLKAKRAFIGPNTAQLKEDINKEKSSIKKPYLESLLITFLNTPIYEIERMDYSETLRLTQLIDFKKQQAYRILDNTALLEEKEEEYKNENIDTSEGLELLNQAKISFKEERYDEAEAYLEEADLKLEQASSELSRAKGLVTLSKNFFQRFWIPLTIIIFVLAIIAYPLAKRIRKEMIKDKIKTLKLELKTLDKMLKKAQLACFRDKKISEETYGIREDRYKTRIAEIKNIIPVLEGNLSKKEDKKKEPDSPQKEAILTFE